MSFFRRMFCRRTKPTEAVTPPDDRPLDNAMKRAKQEHQRAVQSFVKEASKQQANTEYARFVIKEVLDRADRVRALANDASIKK